MTGLIYKNEIIKKILEEIENTENHEICHHLINEKNNHFCGVNT